MKTTARATHLILSAIWCFTLAITLTSCSRGDDVDEAVKSQMTRQGIPGLSMVVLKHGKVIKAGAYGVADVESEIPATTDTVFRIQSMTKQFTAAGIMILAEEGKIGLDDPVSRYLNGCPDTWKRMTVRHLLAQTSGLTDFINEPVGDLRLEVTEEQIMESLAARPLKFEPGDAWDYSNSNYHLLAMIIRKVSGQWYGDFLAQRIFKPLGMTRTAVMRDGVNVEGRALGYWREKGQLRKGSVLATSILSYGGGGIQSTVLALAKWDAALYTEQLLKRATLEQMWTPVKLNNGTTHGYGFGWEIGEIASHRRIWHGGNWTGFTAHIDRFVDDQLTVIMLANLSDSELARITRAIAGIYLPAVAPPVYKPIVDKEPTQTAQFFDVMRRSSEGGLRAEEFTPAVWEYIGPRIDQMRRDMAVLGPLEKLTLVERSDRDGERSYRYRARFKNTTFILHFVVTKEDQISVMMPEQVNE